MKTLREESLRAKGWTEEEISEAREIFQKAKNNKKKETIFFEKLTYWLFFLLVIVGGIASAWIMEPLLFVLSKEGAILVSASFGILFGGLISFIVKDIEQVQSHHHVLIALMVVISTIGTSIFFGHRISQVLQKTPELISHDPYLMGITFSFATIVVYGIFMIYRWKKYGSL